jgi:phosphate acyltransferase
MADTRLKIAVDAMGGDNAPREIVAGAIRAAAELDVDILLVGDSEAIQAEMAKHDHVTNNIEIIPADGVVSMEEEALVGVRRKPNASINVSMKLVKQDKAQAVVSAGHSGAAMAAALLGLGRVKGIDRPAIGAVFPTVRIDKSVVILDVGANVDCKPKYLEQFALMGTVYSKYVLGVEKPKVGLVNIGEESSKGNELAKETYKLLDSNPLIEFLGNAEGRDILSGNFDVIVCDGFVGNILLKFTEAVGGVMLQIMKEELPRGTRGKIGATILKPNLKRIKQRVDHAEHGGALLFGVNGVCIVSHGSSDGSSIFNAIRIAKECVNNQIAQRIKVFQELLCKTLS